MPESSRLLGKILATLPAKIPPWAHIDKLVTIKLWVLVPFNALGGSIPQLIQVYQTWVPSTLEFVSPVFPSDLTLEQSQKIEMVLEKAFAVILGENYMSYERASLQLNMERLVTRREIISIKFALKFTKSVRHIHMFPTNPNFRANMRCPQPFIEFACHTSRYFNSSIPSFAL